MIYVIVWIHSIFLIGEQNALAESQWNSVYDLIRLHASHMYQEGLGHAERHIADNHHLQIGMALIMLGVLFPAFGHSEEYIETGRQIVSDNLEYSIYADGVNNEDSMTYSHFIARLYLEAELLLKKHYIRERRNYNIVKDAMNRIANAGIVPVVVLDHAKDAVPVAQALLMGGIDVMEITFRTAAASDSIKAVSESCPDMLVGAGTVITLEQCKKAVECGAKFIVSPGFDPEVVKWCVESGVAVTPGCVTPTEIMAAMKLGLKVVKFFPAGVYGGLSALKALSGPFGGIKFIPTGGVSTQNIGEFIAAPFIHAVGGSWVCPKADIAAGNFEKITKLSMEARNAAMGFEVAHIGINCENAEESLDVCKKLNEAFSLPVKEGNSSNFASSGVEVMKSMYLGKNGHIAIRTNTIPVAIAELEKRGFVCDMETAKYKGDKMIAVYLKSEFGGFAVHLLQK